MAACNINCDISHDVVCDLLGLTMLVYDYEKKFILDKNETIEGFIGSFTPLHILNAYFIRQKIIKNVKLIVGISITNQYVFSKSFLNFIQQI